MQNHVIVSVSLLLTNDKWSSILL